MTCGEETVDRIRNAHNLVTKAAKCWNAGNVAALQECVATLEKSAVELRAAAATATILHGGSLPGFSAQIFQIKERVAWIERQSDLAAAFLRSNSESTRDSPLYRPGGLEDAPDSSSPVTTRIQA
jgi:hypothetical protein